MGSRSVDEAKKWLRQHVPVPDRVAALIMYCAEGGMKPGTIKMSTDLYIQIAKVAAEAMGKELDMMNIPPALSVSLGNHELNIVHDEEMPRASMHATRQT